MNQNRQKVGAQVLEVAKKESDIQASYLELTGEMLKDLDVHVQEAVERGKKRYTGDFFIELLLKTEKVLNKGNAKSIRMYFIDKSSCPTPNYDQMVWHYTAQTGDLKELWVIPDREHAHYLIKHMVHIPPSEMKLLNYVLSFKDGCLFKKCKKLNNEMN